jgi:hypothetical protein
MLSCDNLAWNLIDIEDNCVKAFPHIALMEYIAIELL